MLQKIGENGPSGDEKQSKQERIPCPLAGCWTLLAEDELLAHLFNEHLTETPRRPMELALRMRRVDTGERTLLLLVHWQLPVGQDQCLGVLNWTGSSRRCLFEPQRHLQFGQSALAACLPVLVMARRTTWSALLADCPELDNGHPSRDSIVYRFWLLAPATRQPVHASLGFINCRLQCGLRALCQLRSLGSQLGQHCLTLSESQMDQMCCPHGSSCFLELVIIEAG